VILCILLPFSLEPRKQETVWMVENIPQIKSHATRKTEKNKCRKSVEVFSLVLYERSWPLLKLSRMAHVFRRVWQRAPVSFLISVRPHVSAWLPLDGFPWNLIWGTFMKVHAKNPDLVKFRQKYDDLTTFHWCRRQYSLQTALVKWTGMNQTVSIAEEV
jgi:hypothetical protein